ncbi:class I SAM-dependent methyltransferase [Candidatus Fermentibacterales bacterium]|nr:class I SAM-dependent methyltransferase [Candidatus Fermentibacterales bacterium]
MPDHPGTERARPSRHERYDPAHYVRVSRSESRHFWFRMRTRIIRGLLERLEPELPEDPVLEVGCGTGSMLRSILPVLGGRQVIGMDFNPEGLARARQAGPAASLVAGDASALPLRGRFSLIMLLDVLEHVEKHAELVGRLAGYLAGDGLLMITVPACQWLWSGFDEASGHLRRYHRREIADLLMASGLEIRYLSYFMATTFPLLAAKRLLSRLRRLPPERSCTGDLRVVPGLNGLLLLAGLPECWLAERGLRLPLGSSIMGVAARPSGAS